jgi:mannitol-specific phosphotransferase system IIBC component
MRELLKDKRFIYISSGLIGFIVIFALAINLLSSNRKELKLLKEQRKEMLMLKDEFLSLKQKIDVVESKKNLSNVQGIIQAVDEVFLSIRLKDRVKTVKSTGKRDIKDGFEEEAELQIEKVSMNEMVNIFHKIENAPMVLTIKKAAIKKSFENPELLNINLTLSFLKTK